MSEENKIGYYAVIPATILFNKDLKANEKLLYAIVTILSNKEGYCFASNAYLSNLLDAQPHTPYTINRTYPYSINGTEGMSQKGQYNIISNNKIDRFFNYKCQYINEQKIQNKNVQKCKLCNLRRFIFYFFYFIFYSIGSACNINNMRMMQ